MEAEKRILIIEDDTDIAMIEEAYLSASGFETKVLSDGLHVKEVLEKENFDLNLLDLMLPQKDGYEICKEIRPLVKSPILMVTVRSDSVDKIRGLGIGADDYISKPFDPAELVARVHANIRQVERLQGSAGLEVICIGDVQIYVDSWKVFKGQKEVKLPNKEFELLKFMAMHPNIVFSKE